MNLERIKTQKEKLSKTLLIPNAIDYIFGVGIGIQRNCNHSLKRVVGLDSYNIRIYGTNNPEQKLFGAIEDLFNISIPVPQTFPIRLVINNEETEIRFIKAPRPILATNTIPDETDKCINFLSDIPKSSNKKLKAGCRVKLENGDTGTLGFFCRLKSGNTKNFLLSNSHVIAANGKAQTTAKSIYYKNRKIAVLYKAINQKYLVNFGIDNSQTPKGFYTHKMDAALAELLPNIKPTSTITKKNGGTVVISDSYQRDSTKRTDPTYSYRVTKHGYGSCETGGWIDDTDCDFLMNEPGESNKIALFKNQLRVIRTIEPNTNDIDNQYTFGTNGDSGSLVFDNNVTTGEHKAIGLFFAFGREGAVDFLVRDPNKPKTLSNCYSVVTPISVIEEELGIELIYSPANSASSS